MVPTEGFEPPKVGFEDRCPIQLDDVGEVLPGGIEPRASGMKIRRPNQLDDGSGIVSSGGFEPHISAVRGPCTKPDYTTRTKSGAPGGIRTPNLADRSGLLFPLSYERNMNGARRRVAPPRRYSSRSPARDPTWLVSRPYPPSRYLAIFATTDISSRGGIRTPIISLNRRAYDQLYYPRMEPATGLEPAPTALQRRCSAVELRWHFKWSREPGSNWRSEGYEPPGLRPCFRSASSSPSRIRAHAENRTPLPGIRDRCITTNASRAKKIEHRAGIELASSAWKADARPLGQRCI
jgi:hypothetical protein